jgi:hypothetical protein
MCFSFFFATPAPPHPPLPSDTAMAPSYTPAHILGPRHGELLQPVENPTPAGSALLSDLVRHVRTPIATLGLYVNGRVHQWRIQLALQKQQLHQPWCKLLWAWHMRGDLGGGFDDLAGPVARGWAPPSRQGTRKTGCTQCLREGLMSSIYRSRWSGALFLRRHLGPPLERNFVAYSAAEELF